MQKKQINELNISMPVSIKKEGSVYIAYTPALDISTYGKTKSQAKKSFEELVDTFFEEFMDTPDALEVVLIELGWNKLKNNWQPPKVENTFQDVRVNLAV